MKILDIAYRTPGLLDAKRLGLTRDWSKSLVVRASSSATEIADLADMNKMDVILVVDDKDKVTGVLAPDILKRRVAARQPSGARESLKAAVVEVGKILDAVRQNDPQRTTFEWLSTDDPELNWCENGNHYTSLKPCPDHPG
jgi:hypothetical protein